MWIFLMYLPCSNRNQATLFFDNTLDPQTKSRQGGYNKADWLKGGTFTDMVFFDGRPALDGLIKWLASLFTCHYEPPLSKHDQQTLTTIYKVKETDPEFFIDLQLQNHPVWSHMLCLQSLQSHAATIALYSSALREGEIEVWGPPVAAQNQDLQKGFSELKPGLYTKSDWATTTIINAVQAHKISTHTSDSTEYEMIPDPDFPESDTSADGNQTEASS